MHASTTVLHLPGSHPGAGSTHNPLCSCQNFFLLLAASSPLLPSLAALASSRIDGRCFWHGGLNDILRSLEKVLRFASRLLTLHNLPDPIVPII